MSHFVWRHSGLFILREHKDSAFEMVLVDKNHSLGILADNWRMMLLFQLAGFIHDFSFPSGWKEIKPT
jgi:hypothetical protein